MISPKSSPEAVKFVELELDTLSRLELPGPAGVVGRTDITSGVTTNSPLLGTMQVNEPPPVDVPTDPWISTVVAGSPPDHWMSTPAKRTMVRFASALVHRNPGMG